MKKQAILTLIIILNSIFSFSEEVKNKSEAHNEHLKMHQKMMVTDLRKPLPMLTMMAEHQKQNMRDHLEALRDLSSAIIDKNFDKITEAGKRLGTTPEMAAMCEHMGLATPGFTELGLKMHSEADKITEAGVKKNLEGALIAMNKTLNACTQCHATFKQQIVNEKEWNKLINKNH